MNAARSKLTTSTSNSNSNKQAADQSNSNISRNSSLYNVLNLLRKILQENPEQIGYGTFGLDQIYEKI